MKRPLVAIDARLVGASSGDGAYWTGLLHGLSQFDSEFRFLLLSNKDLPSSIPASFERMRIPARSSRWWSLVKFPLAARKAGARAIHTQYNLSPLTGTRGLTTVHDVSFFIGPEWFLPRDRMFLRRFVPSSCRRAAKVLTVSETSKSEIERFVPAARGKTFATPLACPIGVDPAPAAEAAATIEKLGLTLPYILTVGSRWPRKNQRMASEAVEGLGPGLAHRLAIVGQAGWGDESDYPRSTRLGYVDSHALNCLYTFSNMYIAPSRHEGFGLPVLEAFRCGCPVACSTGGALPEVAGEAGTILVGWDSAGWSAQLREALADSSKLDRMREAGRTREKNFSWEKTARATTDRYREVAG